MTLNPLDFDYITSGDRGESDLPFIFSPQEAYLLFMLMNNIYETRAISFINVDDFDYLESFLTSIIDKLMTKEETEEVMIGKIEILSYDAEPAKWMKCDGRTLLRSEYPDLFDAIGTSWGYSNPDNFLIPDFRMRSPMGQGALVGNEELYGTYNIGFQGGDIAKPIEVENLPPHEHSIFPQSVTGTRPYIVPTGGGMGNDVPNNTYKSFPVGDGVHFNVLHPVAVVNIIIRVLP